MLKLKLKEDYAKPVYVFIKKLKNKPALVLHSHDSGDKCDTSTPRRSDIRFECCGDRSDHALGPIIRNVLEPSSCVYVWEICVPLLCPPMLAIANHGSVLENRKMDNIILEDMMRYQSSTRSNIFFKSLVITSSNWNNFHIGNNGRRVQKASGNQRCKTSCLLLPSN